MSGQKNDAIYAATVAFAVATMRELGWMPPSNTSTDPPQDDLIERLRAVEWEEIDDGDRMPDDPTHKCVFVDMRPDDFRALLREAAAALEAAREDAAEAKQNGYELGLLAAAREDGWQPIETAPKDGTRVLLWIEWSDVPVVGGFRHGRWWADTEHYSVSCGAGCYGGSVSSDRYMKPTHWRPLPAPPAIDAHLRESDKRAVADG